VQAPSELGMIAVHSTLGVGVTVGGVISLDKSFNAANLCMNIVYPAKD